MTDYSAFSRHAFDALKGESSAARALADQLAEAVVQDLDTLIGRRLSDIVAELNRLGHELAPYGDQRPGDRAFRDEDSAEHCRLRVGCDVIISTGYADILAVDDESPLESTDPDSDLSFDQLTGLISRELGARLAVGDDPSTPEGCDGLAELIADMVLDNFVIRNRTVPRYKWRPR